LTIGRELFWILLCIGFVNLQRFLECPPSLFYLVLITIKMRPTEVDSTVDGDPNSPEAKCPGSTMPTVRRASQITSIECPMILLAQQRPQSTYNDEQAE
jgi:hypothetical protein